MKRTILSMLVMSIFLVTYSQDSVYISRMQENVTALDSAKTSLEWLLITNNFELLAAANMSDWLPEFYTAYSNLIYSMMLKEANKKTLYMDKAMVYVNYADSLKPDNDEIILLKAFIIQMQISLRPAMLGPKLGPKFGKLLARAYELNPNNPRYFLLKGENLFYTPAMFGGDKAKACEMFNTSKALFASTVPQSNIYPHWGLPEVIRMLQNCEVKK